jgi:FkbM family methyltransferase
MGTLEPLCLLLRLLMFAVITARAGPASMSVAVGKHHEMKACKHGLFLINTQDTYVGRSLREYGEWSELEFEMFAQIVQPGDFVVDIGANMGGFTIGLSNLVGEGTLWAFEPQRLVYQLLVSNLALNEIRNTRAYQIGIGGIDDSILVPRVNYSKPGNFGGISLLNKYSRNEVVSGTHAVKSCLAFLELRQVAISQVELRRLDSLLQGQGCPDFIKLDIEGMEYDALNGSATTLNRCHPTIYIEVCAVLIPLTVMSHHTADHRTIVRRTRRS